MLSGQNVSLGSAAASLEATDALDAPSDGGDGVLLVGGDVTRYWLLRIFADGAANFTGSLYGYLDSAWSQLISLNGGSAIALTEDVGWADRFYDLGVFSRIAVAGSISANNVGWKLYPLIVRP